MKIKLFFLIFFVLLFVSCSSSRKISTPKTNKVTITESPYKNVSPVQQVQHVKKLQKSNKSLNKYSLQYIKKYAPIAVSEMHKYNVPASITLAQGILESGNGRSQLASKSNNHFGIKCHTTWTGERVYHDDDELGECFRKYSDVKYSYRDHSLFLTQRSRYADLFKLKISDYQGWAKGLKKAGYATDPKYPDKLISLIERFDLWQYDQGGALAQASSGLEPQNESESINARAINAKNRIYVVVPGDTLYSLSKRFGLTVDQIMEHNKLESIDLSIGQELRLPK